MAVFDLQNIKTLVIFQYIYLKFCTCIQPTGFFHMFSVFRKFEYFLRFFLKIIFLSVIFKKGISNILRILYSSLIEKFIHNLLLETKWFYLSNFCVTAFPANHYFCLKPWKHVTLTSFMTDVSELASFPFVRWCQILGWKVGEVT